MDSKAIAHGILRAVVVIVGVALLFYFLYEIQAVIAYVALAAVVSLIGRPIVLFLERRLKFSNTVAVVLTILFFLALIVGLIGLFVPLIIQQGENLSLLDMESLEHDVENLYAQAISYLTSYNIDIEETFRQASFLDTIDYAVIPDFLNSIVSGFGSFSIALFSVLFISFFFLKDSKLFENSILTAIPDNKVERWKSSTTQIKNLLSRYFVGLLFQIVILFIIYTVGLLIIGVQNAIVIAFLCALFNLIPYVGPLIGTIVMITLTMTSYLGTSFSEVILPKTLWVGLVLIIGQLVDNFFSQPFIFSKSVKSHPLEIFLVILIAGILFGVLGLIVAVPAYTGIKVILKAFLSENKIVKHLTKNL